MTDPKLTHNMEQMAAFLVEMAVSLSHYQRKLEETGFTRTEAFQLVRDYQLATIANAKSGGAA